MSQDGRDRYEHDDLGQADYSRDYGYDPRRREGYRIDDPRLSPEERDYARRMNSGRYPGDVPEDRSWPDRSGITAGHEPDRRRHRGPSDRVLWAVIVERLDAQRHLDLRDVEVIVEDGEVTLNGSVAYKADKRRIEDIADMDGVSHVQNNLRVRHRNMWGFR